MGLSHAERVGWMERVQQVKRNHIERELRIMIEQRRQGHDVDFRPLYGEFTHDVFIAMMSMWLDVMVGA